jgi:hypothetical protein
MTKWTVYTSIYSFGERETERISGEREKLGRDSEKLGRERDKK